MNLYLVTLSLSILLMNSNIWASSIDMDSYQTTESSNNLAHSQEITNINNVTISPLPRRNNSFTALNTRLTLNNASYTQIFPINIIETTLNYDLIPSIESHSNINSIPDNWSVSSISSLGSEVNGVDSQEDLLNVNKAL